MQKLTLHCWDNINKSDKKYVTAKFNIGQRVYVFDWSTTKPIILESYILAIGVESIFQSDNLIYLIDRQLKDDDYKKYYEKDVYCTRSDAAKSLIKLMKKQSMILKDMLNHPYYKYNE